MSSNISYFIKSHSYLINYFGSVSYSITSKITGFYSLILLDFSFNTDVEVFNTPTEIHYYFDYHHRLKDEIWRLCTLRIKYSTIKRFISDLTPFFDDSFN